MATKVKKTRDNSGHENGALYELMRQYNNLAAKFDALLAKLDADAGVTDNNYVGTLDSNSANGAQQIGDDKGTTLS
jgi:hypothetical protein